MPSIEGLKDWFLDQAQSAFVICFIVAMVFAIWKRSIGLAFTFICAGAVIGIFIFAPEAMESLATALRSKLGF